MSDPSSNVEPLDYSMGVIRLFCLADIGRRGLVSGWATPEESHCWNEGADAVLLLSARPPGGASTLSIEGEAYVPPRQPVQDMTVYANGHRAGYWRLTSRDESRLDALIERDWWILSGAKAILRLTFHLPNSIRPSEAVGSSDARQLGFCFRSFSLTEPIRRL